jgi:hypothetical protein
MALCPNWRQSDRNGMTQPGRSLQHTRKIDKVEDVSEFDRDLVCAVPSGSHSQARGTKRERRSLKFVIGSVIDGLPASIDGHPLPEAQLDRFLFNAATGAIRLGGKMSRDSSGSCR